MLSVRHLIAPGIAALALEVAAGECVAVMGPSGAGKTGCCARSPISTPIGRGQRCRR